MAHKSSSSSDDEDYNHYEDHYAEQIGKSVKCTQFINNTTAMKGPVKQGQAQVQGNSNKAQKKKKAQVQVQVKPKVQVQSEAPPTPTILPRNIEKEIVDDWEDLLN